MGDKDDDVTPSDQLVDRMLFASGPPIKVLHVYQVLFFRRGWTGSACE